MNRLRYRIVFNRTRAMFMAVAETASSIGTGKLGASKQGNTKDKGTDAARLAIPTIRLAILGAMGLPFVAVAQIVADPNAGANRPGVIQTANGLPQVNITRPSGAGVSVNQYTQFDVNKPGAILNNSPVITGTQQAGYINGNPNLLPGGAARIIVNQVNSTSPSQLRGYLEVAGQRADVVIANPNGLLVDGAGFINTSRVTLTTGTPIYGGSGSLDAFRVTGGQINVEGAGLNAASIDQVDLIARAVTANAAIYANKLNVVAGANQVDYNSLAASTIAGTGQAPAVGIDVSQLGGMYANKILLASTELGVGVSTRGVLAAQAGDLTLTTQGKLVLAGQTNASGNIAVSARDGIDHSGTTYAAGPASVQTDGTLVNSGMLVAQQSLGIQAQSVASSGTLAAGLHPDGTPGNAADLMVNATGAVSATGQNLASGNVAIQGSSVSLAGSQTAANGNLNLTASAGNLDLTGSSTSASVGIVASAQGALVNDRGQMSSQGAISLTAGSLSNQGGQIEGGQLAVQTTGDLSNRGGSLAQYGQTDTTIRAGGKIDNTDGTIAANGQNLAVSAASVDNSGGRIANAGGGTTQIVAQQQILNATGATGTKGFIGGNGALNLNAGTVLTNQGSITAQGDASLKAQTVDNDNGSLTANGKLLVATTGATSNRGGLISAGTTELTAASLDNAGGRVEGDSVNIATTGDMSNRGGTIKQYGQTDTSITAGATLDNTAGTLAANGASPTVSASTLINDSGQVAHAGTGTLTVTSQSTLSNAAGAIQSNGNLLAQATTLDNSQGAITAQGRAIVVTGGNLGNRQGSLFGQAGLTLASGGSVDNTGGSAQTDGNLSVVATGAVVNQDGTLAANGAHGQATVSATSVDNTRGLLVNAGDGATSVTATNTFTNTAGRLGGNGDVTLGAQTLTNTTNGTAGGLVAAGHALALNVTSQLDNRGGTLYGQNLTLNQTGATLNNAGGQVLGGADVKLDVASLSNLGGAVKANQDVAVAGAVSGSGTMIAGRDLTLNVAGNYTNDAANLLRANGNMALTATGTLTNTAALAAAGALTVSGANVMNAAGADINSANTTVTASNAIDNAGRIEGDTVQINSPTMINTGAVIGNNVQVQGADIVNNGASALMAAVQNLKLYASNSVQNLDGATLYSAGNLQIARDGIRDASNGLLANQVNSLVNRSANIEADGDIDIAANQVSNTRTSIVTVAGTPVETAVQTLSLWQAGLTDGDLNNHLSITFPAWRWNTQSAQVSTPQTNALRAPITVTVDKATVTNLNTGKQTLSFTQSPIEEYENFLAITNSPNCDVDTGICSRPIATNATQYYQSIQDNGSTYSITFWPDWDPSKNIRPDQVRQQNFGHDYNEISRTTVTMTATDQLVSATDPAKIQAGGNIRINSNGGNILNQSSTMAAGGNLERLAAGGTVQDVGTTLQQTVTTTDTSTFYWHQRTGASDDTQVVPYPSEPQAPTTVAALPAIATANQTVQTTAQNVTVASVNAVGATVTGSSVAGGGASGTQLAGATGSAGAASAGANGTGAVPGQAHPPQTLGTAKGGIPNLKLPTNGLSTLRTAPGDTYLVATDSRFTQYTSFISSDYMLNALGLDPQKTQKRLGDGFYEEKLVRDQVTQLTGKTFLAGFTDQLEEYKALMNNGVTYAKTFDLTPGVGLTDEQMRQLTTDMVWMVSQDVTLPDGTTQSVLVPKVYLAQGNGVDLKSTGALVAGNAVAINATGTVQNSGVIVGDIATQVVGTDIVNRGSIGGAGTTVVNATQDVRNLGGRIGGQDVVVAAGRDVVNESQTITNTTTLANGNSANATRIGAVASISGTNNVAVLAGRDLTSTGATLSAGNNLALGAGRDMRFGTVATGTTQDATAHAGQDYLREQTIVNQGSTVQAGQGVTAVAGRDMTLTSTNVQSGASTTLIAGQNVAIVNATNSHSQSAGALSNREKSSFTQSSYDETVQGTNVQAGRNVSIGAGQSALATTTLAANGITAASTTGMGSVGITGSTVSAGNDGNGNSTLTVVATDGVTVNEAREVHDTAADSRTRSSGFLSRSSTHDQSSSHADLGVGSSLAGDTVGIKAANDVTIRQSAVTGTDAVNLQSTQGNVVITAGQNVRESSALHEASTSGVSAFAGQGGIGVSVGSSGGSASAHTLAVTQSDARSLVGASNGNVNITAGKSAVIIGSDVIAGADLGNASAGNINVQAQDISVVAGVDHVSEQTNQSSHSRGFGVALVGTPLDTARNLSAAQKNSSGVTRAKQSLNELGASSLTTPQIAVTAGSSHSNSSESTDAVTHQGSSLSGAGNVTLRATGDGQVDANGKALSGDIMLSGSGITAGGIATLDAQRNVDIGTSTDTYQSASTSSSGGWNASTAGPSLGDIGRNIGGGPNSSGVGLFPYGTQSANASGDTSATRQNASLVTGNTVNVTSRTGNIEIAGSGIAGISDVSLSATQGKIDILSGQDSQTQRQDGSGRKFGDLGGSGYAGTVGVQTTSHHLDSAQTTQNTIRSQIASSDGSVSIVAKDDITARGADISAGQNVTLVGKDVVLDPGTDTSATNQQDKSSQYGVTLALSGYSVQAAQAAENAARAVEDGKSDKVAALYATQAAISGWNTYGAITGGKTTGVDKTGNRDNSNGGSAVIKATVSIGGGSQQSDSHTQSSSAQGTMVTAGSNVTIVATGSGTTGADGYAADGDISGHGAQIVGQNVTLSAARDVNLQSAQDSSSQNSSSSGSSASIGVGLGLGGQQNGFTLELAASQNKANANGNSVTNQISHVTASDTLTISSGRDTNLQGAQATGQTVVADVGRNLNIASQQDTDNYHSEQSSSGMQVSLCVPPLCAGTTVSGSASTSSGNTDSTYQSVVEQSGIYAGSGGFNVNVKGNTDLKGGVIASTADSSKNQLTTGTLTTSDLHNSADYKSGSSTIGGSVDSGMSGARNLANSALTTVAGSAVPSIDGSASGTTKSAIASGTVTITDNAGQQALTGKTADQTVVDLNRDTTNANGSVGKIFDRQKVADQQAERQLAAQTVQQAAPIIYGQVGNILKGASPETVTIVHGLVGGLLAQVAGGSFAAGAAGGAAAAATMEAFGKSLANLSDLSLDDRKALMTIAGTIVGGLAGGGVGAVVGGNATQYNFAEHMPQNPPIHGPNGQPQTPFQTPGKLADNAEATVTGTPNQSTTSTSQPFIQPMKDFVDAVVGSIKDPISIPLQIVTGLNAIFNSQDQNQGGHKNQDVAIDTKIGSQLTDRGWTVDDIRNVVDAGPVGTTTDNRSSSKTPDGQPRNDSASVYGSKTGYIVVNDRTGEVVQISGKNDPGWIPDSRIKWR